MKTIKLLLILVLWGVLNQSNAQLTLTSSTNINEKNLEFFALYGNALLNTNDETAWKGTDKTNPFIVNPSIVLTNTSTDYQFGAANTTYLVDVSKDFSMQFEFHIENPSSRLADGVSFNFFANARGSIGSTGDSVGSNIDYNEGFSLRTYSRFNDEGLYQFRYTTSELLNIRRQRVTPDNSSHYLIVQATYSAATNELHIFGRFVKEVNCGILGCNNGDIRQFEYTMTDMFDSVLMGSPWRYFSIAGTTGSETSRQVIMTDFINSNTLETQKSKVADSNNDSIIDYGESIVFEGVAYNTNRINSDVNVQILEGDSAGLFDSNSISSFYWEIRNPGTKLVESSGTDTITSADIYRNYYSKSVPGIKEFYFRVNATAKTEEGFFNSLGQIAFDSKIKAELDFKTKNETTSEEFTDLSSKTFGTNIKGATTVSADETFVLLPMNLANQSELCNLIKLEITDEAFPNISQSEMCNGIRTSITSSGAAINYGVDITTLPPAGVPITISYTSGVTGNNETLTVYIKPINPPNIRVIPGTITTNVDSVDSVFVGVSASDFLGNDISDQIVYSPLSFNFDVVGVTLVTYSVVDSDNAISYGVGESYMTATNQRTYIIKGPESIVSNGILIDATSFIEDVSIGSYDQAGLISRMNVKAWDATTGATISTITSNPNFLSKTTAGVNVITFTAVSGANTASITVIATLKDANSVISADEEIWLSGNGFSIDVADVATADLPTLTNAQAALISTGASLPVDISPTSLLAVTGVYPLDLTATSGTSTAIKTVYAVVSDAGSIIQNDILLNGNDFTVNVDLIAGTDIISAASASAYLISTGEELLVRSLPTNLSAFGLVGVYPVELLATGPDGLARKNVYATIVDSDTVITSPSGLLLDASTFNVRLDNAVGLTDSDVIAKSKAVAYSGLGVNLTDDITSDITSLAIITTGTYTVTLSVTDPISGDTATKTVNMNVFGGNPSASGDVAINGYNFTATLADSNSNIADFTFIVAKSEAEAHSILDTSITYPVTTTPANLLGAIGVGVVDIDLSATDGVDNAEKIVHAVITNNPPVTTKDPLDPLGPLDPNRRDTIILDASDFSIHVNDLPFADLELLSQVIAYNLDENSPGQIIPTFDKSLVGLSVGFHPITVTATDESYDAPLSVNPSSTPYSVTKVINVMVYSDDSILSGPNAEVIINASSFTKTTEEADTIVDNDGLVLASNAFASEIGTGNSITPTFTYLGNPLTSLTAADFDVGGFYSIAANATGGPTPETATKSDIFAIITDDNSIVSNSSTGNLGSVWLHAENFATTVTDAPGLDILGSSASNAKALATLDANIVTSVTSIPSMLVSRAYSVAGVYPVKVIAVHLGQTAVRNIFATITDNNSVISAPDGEVFLFAKNFATRILDADSIDIVSASEAYATDTTTGNALAVTSTPANLLGSTYDRAGVYDIVMHATNGVETADKTVKAIIIGEDTEIGVDGSDKVAVILNAEPFRVQLSTAETMTSQASINLAANAWAFDNLGSVDIPVTSTPSSLAGLGVGVHLVTFSSTSGSVTVDHDVYVVIADNKTVVSGSNPNSEGINDGAVFLRAENFITDVLSASTVDVLSSSASNPIAFNTINGNIIADIQSDPDDLANPIYGFAGVYPVVIRAADFGEDVIKTVYATITDEQSVVSTPLDNLEKVGAVFLRAENFSIGISAAQTAGVSEIVTLSNSTALSTLDATPINNFTTSPASLAGLDFGIYDVSITATNNGETATRTVKVAILDNDTVVSPDYEVLLSAHNFGVHVNDVASANIIALSGATAIRVSDNSSVPTISEPVNLTDNAYEKPGVYKIDIIAIDPISRSKAIKEVSAVIYDDNTFIDNGYYVFANHFIELLDNKNYVDLVFATNAHAFRQTDFMEIPVTTIPIDMSAAKYAIPDVYPVSIVPVIPVASTIKSPIISAEKTPKYSESTATIHSSSITPRASNMVVYATMISEETSVVTIDLFDPIVADDDVFLDSLNEINVALNKVSTTDVVSASKAKAAHMTTGTPLVVISDTDLTLINAVGRYPVVLTSNLYDIDGNIINTVQKTIFVNVGDFNTEIKPIPSSSYAFLLLLIAFILILFIFGARSFYRVR